MGVRPTRRPRPSAGTSATYQAGCVRRRWLRQRKRRASGRKCGSGRHVDPRRIALLQQHGDGRPAAHGACDQTEVLLLPVERSRRRRASRRGTTPHGRRTPGAGSPRSSHVVAPPDAGTTPRRADGVACRRPSDSGRSGHGARAGTRWRGNGNSADARLVELQIDDARARPATTRRPSPEVELLRVDPVEGGVEEVVRWRPGSAVAAAPPRTGTTHSSFCRENDTWLSSGLTWMS